MSFLKHFLLSSFLAAAIFATPAQAQLLSFTPSGEANSGSLSMQGPLRTLGGLTLKNGTLTIENGIVIVKAATELCNVPQVMLSGKVLRAEADISNPEQPKITGLAYFQSGYMLSQIDDPASPDVIFRNHGNVQGRITGIADGFVRMRQTNGSTQTIDLNSIIFLRAARAFVFSVNTKAPKAAEPDTPFHATIGSVTLKATATPRGVASSSVIPRAPKPAGEDELDSDLSIIRGNEDPFGNFPNSGASIPQFNTGRKGSFFE